MKHSLLACLFLFSVSGLSAPEDELTVSDGLTIEDIQSVVRDRLSTVRVCYEGFLKKNPKSRGIIQLSFTVNRNGKVADARPAEDTIRDEEMTGCLIKTLKQWQFPKPSSGKTVAVLYPFQFHSN